MKKKVLYGVALALFASVSAGSLQSCKDDLNDLKTQMSFNVDQMRIDLSKQITELESRVQKNEGDIAKLKSDLAKLNVVEGMVNDLSQLQTDYSNLSTNVNNQATQLAQQSQLLQQQAELIAQINGALSTLAKAEDVNGLKTQLEALQSSLPNQFSEVNAKLSDLEAKLNNLEIPSGCQCGEKLSQLEVQYNELKGEAAANKAAIEALDDYVKVTLKGEIDGEFQQVYLQLEEAKEMISQVLNALQTQIDEINGNIEGINGSVGQLTQSVGEMQGSISEILGSIGEINTSIEEITDMLTSVANILDAVTNKLDKQVTGILIQGVKSPVFGDFRLPIGIKSNILFNWYGYNDNGKALTFPSGNGAFDVTGESQLDLSKLTPKTTETFAPKAVYGDVLLGKVYVTLNPVGTTFANTDVTIEPSAGDPLPISVTLTPSDEVLYHGYSRSEENGFYEGNVVLGKNDIDAVRIKIDDNLKSAMKDALKDRTKHNAAALIKALYDQMSGMLPAYALRYDWSVGEIPSLDADNMDASFSQKAYAVLSQYDLAVATAKPLSFNFLEGQSISHKLPTIGHLDNLIAKLKEDGDLSLKIDPIKIGAANIEIGKIDISTDVTIDPGNIVIDIPSVKVEGIKDINGNDVYTEPIHVVLYGDPSAAPEGEQVVNSIADVYKAIEDGMESALVGIKDKIDNWSTSLDENVNGQLNNILNDIQGQMNDMIGSINKQIDDMIDNIADKFQPVFDKVNKVFDIYNKIANKVNKILEDPNAYLQVTALYKINGGYGFVSGKLSDPTPYVKGNSTSFGVYLTSYTGELIAPAYKKYVAVTGVYKNGKPVSADLNALNASADLNTVLDGSRIGVVVNSSNFVKGNVYQFTYQALDYHGKTSTKKFYIEVQ